MELIRFAFYLEINWPALGVVGGARLRLGPIDLEIEIARERYEGALPALLAGVDADL